jgi:integrase
MVRSVALRRVTGHVFTAERLRGDQWYAKWRDAAGVQHQRRLGDAWKGKGRPTAGYLTKKMADDALGEILVEAGRVDVTALGRPVVTLRVACDAWLRGLEHDHGREWTTVRDYQSIVRNYFLPVFGADTSLDTIDRDRVDEWRRALLEDGRPERDDDRTGKPPQPLSRRTVQKAMTALHSVYAHATREGWVTSNPVTAATKVRLKRSGEFNVLSVEEVEAVVRAAPTATIAAAITVAAYTGLRMGELRSLRWGHVDFATANVHVRRNLPAGGIEKTPKSGKVRSVPLMDDAAVALDGLSRRELFTDPDDHVFSAPLGGAMKDATIRDGLYDAMAGAGIERTTFPVAPGFRFHDLRHTFGTLAVQVWPLADVQAYMGHADIQTTMIYAHHIPKTDAAAAFTAFVRGQRAGVDAQAEEDQTMTERKAQS